LKLEIWETTVNAVTDLDVYNLSEDLSDMVWFDFDAWPEKAKRTMGYQVIRSSDSIAANISEGYGRYTLLLTVKGFIYTLADHLRRQRRGCERRLAERSLVMRGQKSMPGVLKSWVRN
jgi:hypothetical protein